ncbi:hypothetical protein EX895_004864 [Sporisorium graminicola]|uniref:Zn(2)-C6 fungal-type domain-containing protein n=1 Tax=Sporisorium graminicola TaxID=280036 RepID=A0A4V6ETC3_9BASI|nr:hypothetical protein EX895_004864 [Sporisorium graminicola]TKY86039.1 hypothetical protein EX895_004864 [Sporisorium graminicola]
MDRQPYYADPRAADARASAARPSAARDDQDPRRGGGLDRLPPFLPSSQSLPKLPLTRSDGLAPLGPRLAPIKHSDASSSYLSQRSYPAMAERTSAFDLARHPPSPSSMPVGLVSADYGHSRRSPGDNVGPPPPHPQSSSYLAQHMHPAASYRSDTLRGPPSSHVPRHYPYDAPLAHMRPAPDLESPSSGTPIKRPRVSLACLACRNRKSRCDGVRPTCKTCATMKIDCKWPEVDFRRAKTGDAARARKRSPAGQSSQLSPSSLDQKSRTEIDSAGQMYGRHATARASSSTLPSSQSLSTAALAPGDRRATDSLASSPTLSRVNRYRTHSDGDRESRFAEASFRASRSPTERHMHPLYPQESRSASYARVETHARPYSSAGLPDARLDSRSSWTRDDRAHHYSQDRRAASEQHFGAPSRAMLPESRISGPSSAASRCRDRAAQIAILFRPATDAQRVAVEAHMSREFSLDDLADNATPGERLDHAFAADWDAIGGLSPAARRPFMDVAAGIVGILEIFGNDAQRDAVSSNDAAGRLHLLRLRNGQDALPDLRHLSIAMQLSPHEERELLQATPSAAYDTLSYPIPVDRLSLPLTEGIRRALEQQRADSDNEQSKSNSSSSLKTSERHAASPPPADVIPFVRQQDIKPPQAVLELFFQAYVQAIGDQMPGLDTKVIRARIRQGSISALLANALCAIGASLYERRGQRPSIDSALSSKSYLERARALIGAALQDPDLEAILALGVMATRDILTGHLISSAVVVSSAIRLCMQLDLHRARPTTPHSSPGSATESNKLGTELVADDVFWMTYCLDRVTSIVTARPLVIKDADIDTPFPATMRNGQPCLFAALVRQLHYLGRLVEVSMSGRANAAAAGGGGGAAEREQLREREMDDIGADLVGHYDSLAPVLQLGSANLGRAHDKGEALSFLQLHLTHNMALIQRFLLSRAALTQAEYDAMRSAASRVVEVCMLGRELDANMLADTPLSSGACFLAACVWLSEIEMLQQSVLAAVSGDARSAAVRLESAQSALAKLMETLAQHAKFWPVARNLVEVLERQQALCGSRRVSPATVTALVSQVEAIHVVVRRPRSGHGRERDADQEAAPVEVRKVHDLDVLRAAFPHLC